MGILLAAGNSRRFGCNKLLQPMATGVSMLAMSAQHLAAAVDHTLVLIRSGQPEYYAALNHLDVEVIEITDSAEGMGSTLATGIRAAKDAGGWLVALGDMPYIRAQTLHSVVAALRNGAMIAAPYYQGQRGHPVGFAATCYTTLERLQGDSGPRQFLEDHADCLISIAVDDAGSLFDIDTPQDLEHFMHREFASSCRCCDNQ